MAWVCAKRCGTDTHIFARATRRPKTTEMGKSENEEQPKSDITFSVNWKFSQTSAVCALRCVCVSVCVCLLRCMSNAWPGHGWEREQAFSRTRGHTELLSIHQCIWKANNRILWWINSMGKTLFANAQCCVCIDDDGAVHSSSSSSKYYTAVTAAAAAGDSHSVFMTNQTLPIHTYIWYI